MLQKARQGLPYLFLVLFAVVWGGIILLVCRNNHLIVAAAALTMLLVLWVMCRVLRRLDGPMQSDRWFWLLFAVLAAVFFIACAAFGWAARVGLPSDTDIVYDSVADLLRDGRVNEVNPKLQTYYPGIGLETNGDYFCMYYNNIAVLVVLAGVYWLTGGAYTAGTVEGQTPALIFTAVCMLATVLLICRIVWRLTGRRSSLLMALLLCMAFQPFYYGVVNFYTDVIVLPFAVGALAALVEYFVTQKQRWLAACGALLGWAVCIKMTAAILLVAVVLVLLFTQTPWRQTARQLLVLLVSAAAVLLLFRGWVNACGWFDFSRREELSMPWQLWLCFSARGVGYQYEDALLAAATPPEQRSAVMWQRLQELYASYTPGELLRLQLQKLNATWNDGRFEMSIYAAWPHWSNWSVHFTQAGGTLYTLLYWFGQAYNLLLYLLLEGAVLRQLRKKQRNEPLFATVLCVFGTVLYLLLFETAARRALLVMPLLLAAGACALTETESTPEKLAETFRRS